MKKIFKNMAWMLTATLVMAACSDSLDESSGNGNSNEYVGTKGYVRVAINTPTTSGSMTRANDDQTSDHDIEFNDGTTNEYKINDGVIVFFKTAKENAGDPDPDPDTKATFVSAYKLSGITTQDDPSAQVTEKVVTVTEAPMVDETKNEKLYALVILNVPSSVTVDATTHSLTINNGETSSTPGELSDFQAILKGDNLLSNYIGGDNKDGFTMCNAPLSTVPGTGAMNNVAAKTLVPVEVYPTENEALSHDAARIYVERVVAKVTLSGFTYSNGIYEKTVNDNQGIYNGDVVKLEGWLLNVTNNSTKLVRDVSGYKAATEAGSWLANATGGATNTITRFAGTSVIPIDFSGNNYYRIYWAEDGNYKTAVTNSDFTTYYNDQDGIINTNNPPKDKDWNENTADNKTDNPVKDYALYCFENTMDYDKQVENQTTSVLLKTIYKVKFQGQTEATKQDFFICGASPTKYPANNISLNNGGGTINGICKVVTDAANNVLAQESTIAEGALSLKIDAKGGIYNSKDKLKELFELQNGTDDQWNAIWNQVGTIRYYEEGISYYYAARIRHFNDDETDWNDGETYGIQHLGRYGVVRNNWYEVKINKITGPGEPVITKPGESSDDKAEGYIRAEINVLSWAKRSQGVEL